MYNYECGIRIHVKLQLIAEMICITKLAISVINKYRKQIKIILYIVMTCCL